MYPVDVVKTRMQALACNTPKFQSKSVVRNILFMMREEGFWRPVQGVQAMALGAGPAHAMYFLSYETMKERLAPRFKQVILFTVYLEYHQWCIFPSGVHLNSHCTFWPAVVPPSSMTLWWLLLRWMNILLHKFLFILAMHCQVIKQRMQMCCSPHKNATSAFRVSLVERVNHVEK